MGEINDMGTPTPPRKRPSLNRFGGPVMRPVAATLWEWEIAGAKALGKGNFSLGVRKALKRAGVKPPVADKADSLALELGEGNASSGVRIALDTAP